MFDKVWELVNKKGKDIPTIIEGYIDKIDDRQVIDTEDRTYDPKLKYMIWFRASQELSDKIERLAIKYNKSKASIVRRIIRIILEKEAQEGTNEMKGEVRKITKL